VFLDQSLHSSKMRSHVVHIHRCEARILLTKWAAIDENRTMASNETADKITTLPAVLKRDFSMLRLWHHGNHQLDNALEVFMRNGSSSVVIGLDNLDNDPFFCRREGAACLLRWVLQGIVLAVEGGWGKVGHSSSRTDRRAFIKCAERVFKSLVLKFNEALDARALLHCGEPGL